jgi:hypothetical protein
MSQIQPQETFVIASSLFAGMFMLKLSLQKRAIKWKTPRRCPSCGRSRGLSGICNHCA